MLTMIIKSYYILYSFHVPATVPKQFICVTSFRLLNDFMNYGLDHAHFIDMETESQSS